MTGSRRRDATARARGSDAPLSRPRGASALCVAVLIASGLVACASAPEPILIALPSAARGGEAVRPAAASLAQPPVAGVLLVRRLGIPEYMVSRRVRYASDAARLSEWPDAYWAERIEIGMAREHVAAIREALPGWRVCDASCGDITPDITLKVDLQRLDVLRAAGHVVARAQTQLSLSKSGTSATTPLPPTWQRFEQPLPADTPQGQALAMTELLRALADAGATAVLRARAMAPQAGSAP